MSIELINNDNLLRKSYDLDLMKEMFKSQFYKFMADQEFDLTTLLYIKRFNREEIGKFNDLLRKAKTHLKCDIYWFVLFMEQDFMSVKSLMLLLDDRTKEIMTAELSVDHNINPESTITGNLLK
jgi:uncharacterized FlgJ-related protein